MSDISDLYDLVESRLQAVLPNHLRLSDPYRFLGGKNTDSEKRQGYGIKISDGFNPDLVLSCVRIFEQRLTIVLTRIYQGRETQRSKKIEAEKQLLEDLFLVIKDFEGTPTLGDSEICEDAKYESHSGVQILSSDRDDYLLIEAVFRFRYNETVES